MTFLQIYSKQDLTPMAYISLIFYAGSADSYGE
jgi:hypothetical protein